MGNFSKYYTPEMKGDPYVGSKYTEAPFTSVAAYKNYAGDEMVAKYPITDITRNSDGSISFKFMGGVSAGISTPSAHSANDSRIYSLDGRYMGTSFDGLPHGIYVQNGRKFVK